MPRIPPWLLLVLLVLYVLSPVDLVPDVLGLPGRLDDLLVAAAGLFYLHQLQRRKPGSGKRPGAGRNRDKPRGSTGEQTEGAGFEDRVPGGYRDPYEVMGLPPETPVEEIRRHYKEQLLRYHPDRVQHLGEEFQDLAEQKTKDLNSAFEEILHERGGKG